MSKKKRPLTSDEVAYFCYQLEQILDSGVPVYDGLSVMEAEARDKSTPEANALLRSVIESLSMEKPLFTALEEAEVFPDYCIKTVMAGELSGRLDEALAAMTEYYEKQARLEESVRSAVTSPMIMLVIAAAVISVLTLKVLPMFADIFAEFDPEICETVSRSVETAAFAGTVMLVVCGIMFAAGAVFLASSGRSRGAGDALVSLPFFRGAAEAAAMAKFSGAVSMMIMSGLSASEALSNVRGISSCRKVNEKIDKCAELVLNDVPFSDAVEQSGLLPVFYAQTLRVSYSSGSFDTAWQKISRRLSEEADRSIERIISGVEPALTAVLTLAAGTIMLTVMLPLMNIMSAMI